MFTYEVRAGRLVELRVWGVFRLDEMMRFRTQAAALMMNASTKVVFCSDIRRVTLLSPEVFDALVAMMRTDNPKVERNALVIGTGNGAVLALQMQRLVEESGSARRRVFRDADEGVRWLSEILTPEESTRLAQFIAEGSALTA